MAANLMKIPISPSNLGWILGVGVGGTTVAALLYESFYTVEGGENAVIFSRWGGVKDEVIKPGTHLKIPFFWYPQIYSVRSKPHVYTSLTGSKDLQMVNVTLRVLAKPHPPALAKIHKEYGPEFDERVLPSICNEILKATVAQFNASQLITMRSDVSALIAANLMKKAATFNIILDDVSITHLKFGTEFSRAVEEKKVAQQDAERAQILVQKAKQEREGLVVRAQGQAESAKLIGAAAQGNPGYLELMRIDSAKAIATALARSTNQVYLNADNLLLNLLSHRTIDTHFTEQPAKVVATSSSPVTVSAVVGSAAPVPIHVTYTDKAATSYEI